MPFMASICSQRRSRCSRTRRRYSSLRFVTSFSASCLTIWWIGFGAGHAARIGAIGRDMTDFLGRDVKVLQEQQFEHDPALDRGLFNGGGNEFRVSKADMVWPLVRGKRFAQAVP